MMPTQPFQAGYAEPVSRCDTKKGRRNFWHQSSAASYLPCGTLFAIGDLNNDDQASERRGNTAASAGCTPFRVRRLVIPPPVFVGSSKCRAANLRQARINLLFLDDFETVDVNST